MDIFADEMSKGSVMAATGTRKGIRFALSLALLCAIIAGTVIQINTRALRQLLLEDASTKSINLTHHLEKHLAAQKKAVDWSSLSEAAKDIIEQGLTSAGATGFKRYDATGAFVFDLGRENTGKVEDSPIGEVNAEAKIVIATAKFLVDLHEEIKHGKTMLIAEAYVPEMQNGHVIGVSKVYWDQTETAAMFLRGFGWYSALAAILAALGFAVPAAAFFIRSRQKSAADANVHFLATHDVLTALHNRSSFNSEADKALAQTLAKSEVAILHFIDLDGFKEINDRNGHHVGDQVLEIVAQRLKHTLRAGDIASRFGGDEFVVAQFGFTTNEQIHAATARITDVFKQPLIIDGNRLQVTASIGTSVAPQHGRAIDELVKRADTSVYVVKARGRKSQVYFDPSFDADRLARLKLEQLVKDAVAAKSFHLNYQPLIDLSSADIKGFEALLRLREEKGKAVSPVDFIPVAEALGLIDQIGCWVLEQACLTAANWPKHLQVSVNLSVSQFKSRTVVESTRAALAKSHLEPHRLLLEITESLLMTDSDDIFAQLRELKAMGVAIVMDDFGTGYSSLNYMLKFPFDRIKIDRSFIKELGVENGEADNVVETIIKLGHTLKMRVTAEGVETQIQADKLRAMKCDDAQGYYYGRPVPALDIASVLLKSVTTKNRTHLINVLEPRQMSVAVT